MNAGPPNNNKIIKPKRPYKEKMDSGRVHRNHGSLLLDKKIIPRMKVIQHKHIQSGGKRDNRLSDT